jgi:hypothetical protein
VRLLFFFLLLRACVSGSARALSFPCACSPLPYAHRSTGNCNQLNSSTVLAVSACLLVCVSDSCIQKQTHHDAQGFSCRPQASARYGSHVAHAAMHRHVCLAFMLVLMSTTSGQPRGSTDEAGENPKHPEEMPVLINFSTLSCASSTCTTQVTLSGLLSRGQYTIGIELQALLLEGPKIIFQDFRSICGTLDSSCLLPHNSTVTSTSPPALKATHLESNGDVTLTYDLPVLGDGPLMVRIDALSWW